MGLDILADNNGNDGDDLDRRIADAQQKHDRGATRSQGNAETKGWAVGIEFVGAILVSGFIGFMIDRFAGTSPWFMIGLLLLGFAAGTRRAMKTSAQFDSDPTNDPKN